MITTKTIQLNKPENFDNIWIEQALIQQGFQVVRWAIIDITNSQLILTISYEVNN